MRRFKLFVLLPLIALTSGCVVVSLHPLSSKETFVKDDRVMGTWTMFSPTWSEDCGEVTISNHPHYLGRFAPYMVRMSDIEGHSLVYHAELVKLGESFYLDMIPEETGKGIDPHMLHPHKFTRIKFENDQIILQDCDIKKFRTVLKEKPNALSAEKLDGKLVLTSKTPELQAFFRTTGDLVVGEPVRLRRKVGEQKPREPKR